jgi:hypothetical protein
MVAEVSHHPELGKEASIWVGLRLWSVYMLGQQQWMPAVESALLKH